MISIKQTFYLDHNIKDVYEFVNDPVNEVSWVSSVKKVEQMVDDQLRLQYDFLGRKETFVMQISTEAFHLRNYKSVEGAFPMKGQQSFESIKNGKATKFDWYFEMDPGKYFGLIPLMIIKKATEKVMKKDGTNLNKLISQSMMSV
ncbi:MULTISPECIES: hypothetical protein [Aquimarina]|uniref:SRPBCC family protein n=1 Tax=Aquimarina algiphila TaxID=2047982 RepID=A0A554VM12_9FLAO|nr:MULTISPECIES: hypothetical protein [Aquimarina]TSE09243.1 hypothetical protein FOF46_09260 [Aquimarina algiphila]